MRLMLRLLTIAAIISSGVFAAKTATIEKELVEYIKTSVHVNPNLVLKDVRVRDSADVDQIPGWRVYFLDIDLEIKNQNNKLVTVNDKIFSNGTFVVKDFANLKDKTSLAQMIAPVIKDDSFYKKDRLIYGDFDAPNKLVVFSDPICPACQAFIPKLINDVKNHPKKVALFYYHFPLEMIHPAAATIAKAMIVAQNRGVKDLILKVYEKRLNINSSDEEEILDKFNKALGTKITKEDISAKDVVSKYKQDLKKAAELAVSGTPTLYVNGKKDFSRQEYLKLLK